MSCCGSRRQSTNQGTTSGNSRNSGAVTHWAAGALDFEYKGQGNIRVTGPLTGSIYHFAAGGPPIRVHGADVPSLAAVPGLAPVR